MKTSRNIFALEEVGPPAGGYMKPGSESQKRKEKRRKRKRILFKNHGKYALIS